MGLAFPESGGGMGLWKEAIQTGISAVLSEMFLELSEDVRAEDIYCEVTYGWCHGIG